MQEWSVVFYAPNQILSVSKVRLIKLWRLSDENFKIFKFSYDYCVRLNNQISTDYKFPSLPAPAPAWIVEFSNCGINVHQHKLYTICGCGEKPKKVYSPEMGRLVCKDLELFLTKLPAQSPFQLERT